MLKLYSELKLGSVYFPSEAARKYLQCYRALWVVLNDPNFHSLMPETCELVAQACLPPGGWEAAVKQLQDNLNEGLEPKDERLVNQIAQACENAHALLRERPEKQWTFCEVQTILDSIGGVVSENEMEEDK